MSNEQNKFQPETRTAGFQSLWTTTHLDVWLENSCFLPEVKKETNSLPFHFKAPTPGNFILVFYKDCARHNTLISVQA